MKKLLTRNLGLKLASLLLAFVLWFLVAQIYDPKDTVTFNNIQVRLINTELLEEEGKVYEVLDNSNLVRVTVTGPQSIVKSELRRSDIVAEADMSKLTDINTIAITYYCENISNDSVEIKGNHDSVRLNVEDKTSKWIKLESNTIGDVASGYMIGNVTLDQTNIEVTGPKSAISQVDHAGVDINVTDSTTSLSANVDIKLYDADDNELVLESVKKNVDSAYMTVEVLATKEVPVEIEYMGVPEDGYMATGEVESSVPTVRIAGTVSTLVGISAITVPEDRMNITGQSDNLVDIINLKEYLPANVRLADKSFDGKITATVYIEPIVSKDLTVAAENISVTGVPDGMEAEITSTAEEYNITVSGLSRDVSILHDSSVTGILNLTQWMEDNGVEELTPGTYTIPVTFNLAEDITVTPDINIHIRLKNADTDNQ
jgi:YbbR domain-containing protein